MIQGTRETWLQAALWNLRPLFSAKKLTLPENIRVSCGWPSRGGTSINHRVIGQCWEPAATVDGVTQIFMSPYLADPVKVLETLVHELIHAVDSTWKHGADFRAAAKDLGLVGKPTATIAGDELKVKLSEISETLGPYEHSRVDQLITPAGTPKPSTNRMLKVSCPKAKDLHDGGGEYILRGAKKTLDLGVPDCPICGTELERETTV